MKEVHLGTGKASLLERCPYFSVFTVWRHYNVWDYNYIYFRIPTYTKLGLYYAHINSRKRPLAEKNMPNIRPIKVTKKTTKSSARPSQKDREDEQKLEDGIAHSFIGISLPCHSLYILRDKHD